jgi:transcriptional regulator GlxA family with amidase domain
MVTDNVTEQQLYSDCIQSVQQYIRRHIHEPLNREVLADIAGFSIPHFHRIFIAQTGESAISYVRRMRLIAAGRKLRMGAVDIMQVALAAGYESHAAFSKAFKKQFGVSPSAFRLLGCMAATALLRQVS